MTQAQVSYTQNYEKSPLPLSAGECMSGGSESLLPLFRCRLQRKVDPGVSLG